MMIDNVETSLLNGTGDYLVTNVGAWNVTQPQRSVWGQEPLDRRQKECRKFCLIQDVPGHDAIKRSSVSIAPERNRAPTYADEAIHRVSVSVAPTQLAGHHHPVSLKPIADQILVQQIESLVISIGKYNAAGPLLQRRHTS
jgi:hypothetical protein